MGSLTYEESITIGVMYGRSFGSEIDRTNAPLVVMQTIHGGQKYGDVAFWGMLGMTHGFCVKKAVTLPSWSKTKDDIGFTNFDSLNKLSRFAKSPTAGIRFDSLVPGKCAVLDASMPSSSRLSSNNLTLPSKNYGFVVASEAFRIDGNSNNPSEKSVWNYRTVMHPITRGLIDNQQHQLLGRKIIEEMNWQNAGQKLLGSLGVFLADLPEVKGMQDRFTESSLFGDSLQLGQVTFDLYTPVVAKERSRQKVQLAAVVADGSSVIKPSEDPYRSQYGELYRVNESTELF